MGTPERTEVRLTSALLTNQCPPPEEVNKVQKPCSFKCRTAAKSSKLGTVHQEGTSMQVKVAMSIKRESLSWYTRNPEHSSRKENRWYTPPGTGREIEGFSTWAQ